MPETVPSSSRPRVLSGMRPTGKLHLGNYMGALANWVKLQDQYECYFFIADWHALTTDYADPSRLKLNTLDAALDFLAAGLDPEKSTIFIQSHVPQHAELHLLFSMITPLGWLERVPSYKEQQENLTGKDLSTYGFLGYPLLQAADILLYQAQFVPVGQDQVAHVELTREVARRFNSMYKSTVFPEPEALLTPSPKLPGTDGRKMSKSYGNTIGLTEAPALVAKKVLEMSTNGQRIRQTDPGDPDLCPVGDLHKVFSSPALIAETQAGCRTTSIGCKGCKALVAASVSERVAPIFAKRRELEIDVDQTWEILREESKKAETRAEETMRQAREVLGISRGIGDVGERFTDPVESDNGEDAEFRHWADVSSVINSLNGEGNRRSWHECVPGFRFHWQRKMVPREVVLKKPTQEFENEERFLEEPFMTASGKRALVTVSEQGPLLENSIDGLVKKWRFNIPPRSYEVWVLIAYDGDDIPLKFANGRGMITAFVVPQKFFSQDFALIKRSSGRDESIPVILMRDQSNHFFLRFEMLQRNKTITDLRNNYEPLK
ncbi:MAG: tryptophan--tRNA ligase [Terracidiphilus sp.]